MKLKTSLFKKGLIINDMKRFWWISALYTLALFFTVPFNHYMQKSSITNENLEQLKREITSELSFTGGSSPCLLIIVPAVIGVLVFRYIQKNRSASLYHSLPLTRATLYFNSVISAIILFVVPLLCITPIMLLLNWFSSLSTFYSTILIFSWLGYSVLFGIMFIAIAVFVGMFTGSSIAQLAFVYALNLLPMFFVEFIRMNLKKLLFGFDTYSSVDFYNKMPMSMIFKIGYEASPATLIIVYIAVTITLFIGGLYAFKLRKPETAGDIITFRPIRPLFIYGVTSCATLLGGSYLLSIGNASIPFVIFGYFVSSLISYVIVQMIINRSFKVIRTYKGYIGFALVLAILTLCVKFDVIGYVNKIPNPSDVEETYVGYNMRWWENKDAPNLSNIYNNSDNTHIYKDSQNIENVTKLHKLILDNRSNIGDSQYVAYKLKNGKKFIRKYIIDTDLYASALSPIYESTEYKQNRYPILHLEVDDLKYIAINDSRSQKNSFIVSDKEKLESFKVAIRKDIEALRYKSLVSERQRILYIDIVSTNNKDTKEDQITYMLNSSYKNTLDWLKKEGIYKHIVISPSDVNAVTLQAFKYTFFDYNSSSGSSTSESIKITDEAIIKEILDLSIDAAYSNRAINYRVILAGGTDPYMAHFSMSFDDKVSPELQSYLDKIK